jgi:hypothetical protein
MWYNIGEGCNSFCESNFGLWRKSFFISLALFENFVQNSRRTGTDVMIFKMCSQKNWRFLFKVLTVFLQKLDHNDGCQEKRQFFGKNWRNSQKFVIITLTPDDRWTRTRVETYSSPPTLPTFEYFRCFRVFLELDQVCTYMLAEGSSQGCQMFCDTIYQNGAIPTKYC